MQVSICHFMFLIIKFVLNLRAWKHHISLPSLCLSWSLPQSGVLRVYHEQNLLIEMLRTWSSNSPHQSTDHNSY